MKSLEIIVEELKKAGIVSAEEVSHDLEQVFSHKILPRLAVEAEEEVVKVIARGCILVIPSFEPAIEKALDFNKDGKIGN